MTLEEIIKNLNERLTWQEARSGSPGDGRFKRIEFPLKSNLEERVAQLEQDLKQVIECLNQRLAWDWNDPPGGDGPTRRLLALKAKAGREVLSSGETKVGS